MPTHPDLDRDVIVQHLKGSSPSAERWTIFVGGEKRAELASSQQALVFARLLADLQQCRVWVRHGDGELAPPDRFGLTGCSCC